jgi:hypothetical protein
MTHHKRIEELECMLAESRRVGLSAIARAEKWRAALMKIRQLSGDSMIRNFADESLLDI